MINNDSQDNIMDMEVSRYRNRSFMNPREHSYHWSYFYMIWFITIKELKISMKIFVIILFIHLGSSLMFPNRLKHN